MAEDKMYALTYLYGGDGVDDNPSASTIAVSTNIDTLRAEMRKCIKEDCETPTLDEAGGDEEALDELMWETDRNYSISRDYDDLVYLDHNKNTNVWAKYSIQEVEVL